MSDPRRRNLLIYGHSYIRCSAAAKVQDTPSARGGGRHTRAGEPVDLRSGEQTLKRPLVGSGFALLSWRLRRQGTPASLNWGALGRQDGLQFGDGIWPHVVLAPATLQLAFAEATNPPRAQTSSRETMKVSFIAISIVADQHQRPETSRRYRVLRVFSQRNCMRWHLGLPTRR
jgi:hypothetical protein